MMKKLVEYTLNWLVTAVILPTFYFMYDVYRIRKENKELKKSIEDLKNAKNKQEIDTAIDNIN